MGKIQMQKFEIFAMKIVKIDITYLVQFLIGFEFVEHWMQIFWQFSCSFNLSGGWELLARHITHIAN